MSCSETHEKLKSTWYKEYKVPACDGELEVKKMMVQDFLDTTDRIYAQVKKGTT